MKRLLAVVWLAEGRQVKPPRLLVSTMYEAQKGNTKYVLECTPCSKEEQYFGEHTVGSQMLSESLGGTWTMIHLERGQD